MSNNPQNVINYKILNMLVSSGSAVKECFLKTPALIIKSGGAIIYIKDYFTSVWNKEMIQNISEDFKEFIQVAQNQERMEEELETAQKKLANDIAEFLRQNVDIVCQVLNVGVILFDCINELKNLFCKAKSSLQEMHQELKDITVAKVDFAFEETNKAIKHITELFQLRQHNTAQVEEDNIYSLRPDTEILWYECETTGDNIFQNLGYEHNC